MILWIYCCVFYLSFCFFFLFIYVFFLFFFFFQAEDGIRDRNVTGVQTCALPISSSLRIHLPKISFEEFICFVRSLIGLYFGFSVITLSDICSKVTKFLIFNVNRSEERRVGKECRYWRWTDH